MPRCWDPKEWYVAAAHLRRAHANSATTQIKDSNSWLNSFDLVNESLKAVAKEGTAAVKVAVLDTGCDLEHAFFIGPGSRQDDRLEGHWFDCLGESDKPVDEDPERHGTAMVALLLRLLPNAEIYVVRVARDAEGLSTAKGSIEDVIGSRPG